MKALMTTAGRMRLEELTEPGKDERTWRVVDVAGVEHSARLRVSKVVEVRYSPSEIEAADHLRAAPEMAAAAAAPR